MTYKDYEIVVCVAVCHCNTNIVIDVFDTMRQAKKYVKENDIGNVDYWYLAAETINEDGDVNPAIWDKSRAEAIRRLKKLL